MGSNRLAVGGGTRVSACAKQAARCTLGWDCDERKVSASWSRLKDNKRYNEQWKKKHKNPEDNYQYLFLLPSRLLRCWQLSLKFCKEVLVSLSEEFNPKEVTLGKQTQSSHCYPVILSKKRFWKSALFTFSLYCMKASRPITGEVLGFLKLWEKMSIILSS